MTKRILSLVLSAALILTSVFSMPLVSLAEDSGADLTTVTGTYKYRHFLDGIDDRDMFIYSDEYFRGDSIEFNQQLALMSMRLSATTFMIDYAEPEHMADFMYAFLEDLGFSDVDDNGDFAVRGSEETACAACAHKEVCFDGKKYTLLVILTRGASYFDEWYSNLNMYQSATYDGDSYGYTKCRDKVLAFTKEYIEKYDLSGDIKVWTTSYSRGGGIIDQVGAQLIRDPEKALGTSVTLRPEDLYCYTFGAPGTASLTGDYKDSKYDRIHNVYQDNDMGAGLPPAEAFARYGTQYCPQREYGYYPKKLDTEALLSGELKVVDDNDSYLPYDQASYLKSLTQTVAELMVRESKTGKDGREGYYTIYQEPVKHFISWSMKEGPGYMSGGEMKLPFEIEKDTAIPFMLSMYVTFMFDKGLRDGKDPGDLMENLMAFLEQMSSIAGNGENPFIDLLANVRQGMRKSAPAGFEGIEEKIAQRLLQNMRKMTASAYVDLMRPIFEQTDTDPETIEMLTSDEDSYAMSWLFANFCLGNVLQSDSDEIFSLDNEQFRQFATMYANLMNLIRPHFYLFFIRNLRTEADLVEITDAQLAGYRRLYVSNENGADVFGEVRDSAGNIVATFKNDTLLSSSDNWIGITKSDEGSWLRLPLDKEYSVSLRVGSDSKVSAKVAEYSLDESKVVSEMTGDGVHDWTGVSLRTTDTMTIKLPAVAAKDGTYVLPSGASYNSDVIPTQGSPKASANTAAAADDAAILDPSIPMPKKVKVTAGKKAVTIKWKKLSSKKRKQYNKTEVQYSTTKAFDKTATRSKELAKKKTSFKAGKLTSGTTYYVRVRNVRYLNGKKYVSSWSKPKKAKAK